MSLEDNLAKISSLTWNCSEQRRLGAIKQCKIFKMIKNVLNNINNENYRMIRSNKTKLLNSDK